MTIVKVNFQMPLKNEKDDITMNIKIRKASEEDKNDYIRFVMNLSRLFLFIFKRSIL